MGFVLLELSFSVLCFVDQCLSFLSFFFWSLYCLSFFSLPLLITPLVSSNFSYKGNRRRKNGRIMKKHTIQLNIMQSLKDFKIHSNVVTLLIGQHHIFALVKHLAHAETRYLVSEKCNLMVMCQTLHYNKNKCV
jgi:hypothetical protein